MRKLALFALIVFSSLACQAQKIADAFSYIERGDLSKLKASIEAGLDIDSQDIIGTSLLLKACIENKTEIIHYLLDKKADIHKKDKNAYSPFTKACAKGNLEVARRLLRMGAAINDRDSHGTSPLMNAVASGNIELVRLLLDSGADIAAQDLAGYTPLFYLDMSKGAAGALSIADVLTQAGSDCNHVSTAGYTLLLLACAKSNEEMTRYLLANGADIHQAERHYGKNALITSAELASAQVLTLLLERKPDLELRDGQGHTALMAAAWSKKWDNARALVDAGANMNVFASDAYANASFLELLVIHGQRDLLLHCLRRGADPNVVSKKGSTPFLSIVPWADISTIKLFIEHGANPNGVNGAGESALFLTRDLETAKLLVEKGTSLDLRNRRGATALLMACEYGYHDIARYLIEQGADASISDNEGMACAFYLARSEERQLFDLVLDRVKDVNHTDIYGRTALMFAAMAGNRHAAEALIKKKAVIDAQDHKGMTALMYAAKSKGAAMMKLLKDAGANASLKSKEGLTSDGYYEAEY